mmetsp:Transcript_94965/g.292772  ORF Transcript_94965/g.292772 Transcript_94965/m.292772 type:complete len:438 (-) Transcript_94965:34-1347(-)
MGGQWRNIARIPAEKLAGDVHTALRGRPAVVDLGPGAVAACGVANLLERLASVRLDLRPADVVARSGGSFYPGDSRGPTAKEWWCGVGAPFVFDTRRGSEFHRALSHERRAASPPALRSWSRSPVATLGRVREEPHDRGPAALGTGGLAFHQHERSWLLLASGRKRWYFHVGQGPPATALARVSETELLEHEARAAATGADAELITHEQQPGECVLVPDGVWHCTYNVPGAEPLVFGLGGLGACGGPKALAAAEGDLAALADVPHEPEAAQELACIAAEQAQLPVLRYLYEELGPAPLAAPGGAGGAAPLHFAAAAGCPEVVSWLLERGASPAARDAHGTTAAHWAARSGSPRPLAALREAGADLEAADWHSGCRPLHLFAGEGHIGAARWLVEVAGADPLAADGHGMRPEDWATRSGHTAVAEWLRSHGPPCCGRS